MSLVSLDDLVVPDGWELLSGLDTGTYLSCAFTLISPDPYEALVIAEFPNYRYVGDVPELLGESLGEWAFRVTTAWDRLTTRSLKPWVDSNSQFVSELAHHGIHAQRNTRALELRTEITREYFQHGKILLAPWLTVLPYELERAAWPPEVSSATGRNARLKTDDHTLDCVEHVLSRRPRSKRLREDLTQRSFLDQYLAQHAQTSKRGVDRHLGRN